jgi:hypothetical protein
MIYRMSVIAFSSLCVAFLACGRTDIYGSFAEPGTIPVTTGAGGTGDSTGAAGGTGIGGSSARPSDGGQGNAGAAGNNVGAAGNNTGEAGASSGEAGASTGEGGNGSTGAAGSGAGGHAGSSGQGGSAGIGAGGSQGGEGGSSGIGAACNPVAQNCGAGLRCDLPSSGPLAFECVMDVGGSGTEGQICSESGQDCAKGATCVQTVNRAGMPIGPARCFVFCNSRADCPSGNRCVSAQLMPDAAGNGAGNIRTGICAPR